MFRWIHKVTHFCGTVLTERHPYPHFHCTCQYACINPARPSSCTGSRIKVKLKQKSLSSGCVLNTCVGNELFLLPSKQLINSTACLASVLKTLQNNFTCKVFASLMKTYIHVHRYIHIYALVKVWSKVSKRKKTIYAKSLTTRYIQPQWTNPSLIWLHLSQMVYCLNCVVQISLSKRTNKFVWILLSFQCTRFTIAYLIATSHWKVFNSTQNWLRVLLALVTSFTSVYYCWGM